jgi:hypothetical protein
MSELSSIPQKSGDTLVADLKHLQEIERIHRRVMDIFSILLIAFALVRLLGRGGFEIFSPRG